MEDASKIYFLASLSQQLSFKDCEFNDELIRKIEEETLLLIWNDETTLSSFQRRYAFVLHFKSSFN